MRNRAQLVLCFHIYTNCQSPKSRLLICLRNTPGVYPQRLLIDPSLMKNRWSGAPGPTPRIRPPALTGRRDLKHATAVYFSNLTTFTLTPSPPACKLMKLDEVTGGVCRASKSMCAGPSPKALIRRRLDCRNHSSRMDKQRGTSYLSAAVQYLAVKSQVACARVWRYGSGHIKPLTFKTGGGILGTGS